MKNNGDEYKSKFIDFMVDSGVLTFGDFVTKSGRKTPYFVNTGNYRTGAQLMNLGKYYAECIMKNIGEDFDILFGPAYKGIPLAAVTAAALYSEYGVDRAYCFNRKEAKDHGEGGTLVGAKIKDGDRIVIIEDVVTAGTSVRETLPILKGAANVEVKHMIISVDRMEKGAHGVTAVTELKEDFGIDVHPIVNVREILEHLRDTIPADAMEAYLAQYCV